MLLQDMSKKIIVQKRKIKIYVVEYRNRIV